MIEFFQNIIKNDNTGVVIICIVLMLVFFTIAGILPVTTSGFILAIQIAMYLSGLVSTVYFFIALYRLFDQEAF